MLLTIITVTYNCAPSISRTLESIISEKNNHQDDIEYIVFDGASTDGTCRIIEQHHKYIDAYISEVDNGIYDAMNKAIAIANGEWLLFLNDGDMLFDISGLLKSLKLVDKKSDLVAFSVKLSDGTFFRPEYNWKIRLQNTLHHQGTCYRNNGSLSYNEKYHVFADFNFNQKCFAEGKKIEFIHDTFSFHSLEGMSHQKSAFREYFAVIKNNYGTSWVLMSCCYLKWKSMVNRIKAIFPHSF